MRNRRSRSHTKKGPGRYHGQGSMTTIRPLFTEIRIVAEPQQRLAPAACGGNWQGQFYQTYAEHDRCTRASMAAGQRQGGRVWQQERLAIAIESGRRAF